MFKDNFEISNSDVAAIIDLLGVLNSFKFDGVSEAQSLLNDSYCKSATEKLHKKHPRFDANEVKVISAALTLGKMILSHEIDSDDVSYNICAQYRFSINKLEPQFSSILSTFLNRMK